MADGKPLYLNKIHVEESLVSTFKMAQHKVRFLSKTNVTPSNQCFNIIKTMFQRFLKVSKRTFEDSKISIYHCGDLRQDFVRAGLVL